MFMTNNKLTLYLLLIVAIPIATEMRTIFSWWLGNVPEETILFVRLSIVYIICLTMNAPITIIVQATGKLKHYSLLVETIILMCLPISFFAFRAGAPSFYALLSLILVIIAAHIARMICLRKLYPHYQLRSYLLWVLLPGIATAVITTSVAWFIHRNIDNDFVRFFTIFSVLPVITVLFAYIFGTTKEEKRQLHSLLLKKAKLKL
jgi:hypothetical protein